MKTRKYAARALKELRMKWFETEEMISRQLRAARSQSLNKWL